MPLSHAHIGQARALASVAILLAMVASLFAPFAPVYAVAPENIVTYQGRLLNDNGAPVADLSLDFEFRLYDMDVGGTCLWSNDDSGCASTAVMSVALTDGLFTVNLGDPTEGFAAITDDVFADNDEVYLEVDVEGETLAPRKRITAAAYALNSQTLDGFDSTDFLSSAGDTAAGDYDFTGATFTGATAINFEGTSADGFETSFAFNDPTADNTITFQDASGTVAFLSDIGASSQWETGAFAVYEDDDDVVVGTSGDETIVNATFALSGDDLFVAGSAGIEGDIYSDGAIHLLDTSLTQDTLSAPTVAFSLEAGLELVLSSTGGDVTVDATDDLFLSATAVDIDALGTAEGILMDTVDGPIQLTSNGTSGGIFLDSEDDMTITSASTSGGAIFLNASSGGVDISLGGGAGDDFNVDSLTFLVESDTDTVTIGSAATDLFQMNATILGASPFTFEGASSDAFETTFVITDPTVSDRTITFQNGTGTVAFTSDIPAGASLWEAGTNGTYEDDAAVIVGPDVAETLSNAGFTLAGGNDLFVGNLLGVEGNIYTDGSLVVGATSTYSNGSITDTDSNADDLFDFILSAGTDAFRISTGNLRVGSGTPDKIALDGEDVYVEGSFEMDGSAFVDGSVTVTGAAMGMTDAAGIQLTGTIVDDADATDDVSGIRMDITNETGDAGDTLVGLEINYLDGATNQTLDGFADLDNEDPTATVTTGITIRSTGGGPITTALMVTDPDIGTALAFGANDIDGTNFDVTGSSGDITTAGDLAVNGDDITSDGDLTINPVGGQVLFGDTDVFNIGGVTALSYNAISNAGGSASGGAVTDDNDLYVQGALEVDGALDVAGTFSAGDLSCTDCLDFTEFEDTLDLDASTIVNLDGAENFTFENAGTGNVIVSLSGSGNFVANTDGGSSFALLNTGELSIENNETTTGIAFQTSFDALTSGTAVSFAAGNAFSGNILRLTDANTSTGDFLEIISSNATSTARPIFIDLDNGNVNNDVFVLQSDTTNGSGADTTKARITANGEFLSDVGFTAGGATTNYYDGSISTSGSMTIDSSGTVQLGTDDDFLPQLGGGDADLGSSGVAWDNVFVRNTDDSTNVSLSSDGSGETNSGASVIGVFDEFANSSSGNVQDVLDDFDAAIAAAGTPTLDTVYDNDPDKILNVDTADIEFSLDSPGLAFLIDMQSTGTFRIQEAGTDSTTFQTDGDILMAGGNLFIGSDTVSGVNASFTANGDDLFTTGDIAAQDSIYADAFVAGDATTTFGNGSITDNDSNADDLFDFALAAAADALRITTGNLRVGNGSPDVALGGEDAYIEGTLEADANVRFDGDLAVNGGDITSSATLNITPSGAGNDLNLNPADDILMPLNAGGTVSIDGAAIDATGDTLSITTDANPASAGSVRSIAIDYETIDDANANQLLEGISIAYLNSSEDAGDVTKALRITNVNNTSGSAVATDTLINLQNFDVTADSVSNYLLIETSSTDTASDAIDVSGAGLFNAINMGANFALFDALRFAELATGTLTLEDTGGNDMFTVTDVGATGNLALTGDLAVNGDDITSDGTLTIDSTGTIQLGTDDDLLPQLGGGDADLGSSGVAWDNVFVRNTDDSTNVSLSSDGSGETNSGASVIGTFDEFANSASGNVQDVLDDFDTVITGLAAGSSKWTDDGTFTYLTSTTDDLVVGDTTVAGASLFFDESAGQLDLGTDATLNGTIRLFSSGAVTDPTMAADASGNLNTTLGTGSMLANILTGNLKIGNGAPTVSLDGEDAYIEGTFEVDGTSLFDGAATFDSVLVDVSGTDISLEATASATTSGAFVIGTFDEFDNSNSANVQDVLDDLDTVISGLAAGSSKWTDAGTFTYLTSTTDDLVVGDTTVAGASLFFDESTGQLDLGTDSALAGTIRLYSATAATGDSTLTTDASGDLNLTPGAATALVNVLSGNLQVGNGAPDVTLNGEDSYIEGTLEVDANVRFDGDLALNGGDLTSSGALNVSPGGTLTLGDGGDTTVLNSSDWDVNAAGDMSGIGTITMDGTLTISGVATDITTGAGEALTLIPAGAGDVLVNADTNSNFQVVATAIPGVDMVSITNSGFATTGSNDGLNIIFDTATNGAGTETMNGIDLNLSGSSDAGDTIRGLNIESITGTAANEVGMRIGDGWDVNLLLADTSSVIMVSNGGAISVADSGGNSLMTISDSGTTGDVTITGDLNVNGGNINTVSGSLAITPGTGSDHVNVLTGNLKVGNGTPDVTLNGEDAYIEGTLEVDGSSRFDGSVAFNSGVTYASDFDMNFTTAAANTENLTITQTHGTDASLSTVDISFTNTAAANTGTNYILSAVNVNDGGATGTIDALAFLNQGDTNEAVGDGLVISSTGAGGLTTGLDFDSTNITTELELQNDETINNDTDDLVTVNGAGGTNNTGFIFDVDGAATATPTLRAAATDLIAVDDNFSVGVDGTTAETMSDAAFTFSGNDLFVSDTLGVNGVAYFDNDIDVNLEGATDQITIDAGETASTTDRTTDVMVMNFDVNSATVNGLNIDGDVGTALSAAESLRGIIVSVTGLAGDNAASALQGINLVGDTTSGGVVTAIDLEGSWDAELDFMNDEQISNTTDDLFTFTGTGGTNNAGLVIDLDGATTATPTLRASANDVIAIDDNLAVGVDGNTTETLSNAGFVMSGNDLFAADLLGVEGNIYTDGSLVVGATTTYSNGSITDTDSNADDLFSFNLAAGADSFNVLTGNLRVGNGANGVALNGEDAYIEGTLEVDGAVDFGSASFSCADCIDFDDMEDTLDLDTTTSINMDGTETFTINNGSSNDLRVNLTSTGNFDIQDTGVTYMSFMSDGSMSYTAPSADSQFVMLADNVTTAGGAGAFSIQAHGLTTGKGAQIASSGDNLTSGDLLAIVNSGTHSTANTVSGSLLDLNRNFSNDSGGTVNVTGDVLSVIANTSNVSGTLNDSANVAQFTQSNTAATGAAVLIDSAATAAAALTILTDTTTVDAMDLTANSLTTGIGLDIDLNALSSGSGIEVSTTSTAFDGALFSAGDSGTYTTDTSRTGGRIVDFRRTVTSSGAGTDLTIGNNADVMLLSSNVTLSGGGAATDTSNILELIQNFSGATGTVLNINSSATAATVASFTSSADTTADLVTMSGPALTTGDILSLTGGNFTDDSGMALRIDVTESTATADIFHIQTDAGGANNNVFRIEADGEAFSDVGFTAGAFSTNYYDGSITHTAGDFTFTPGAATDDLVVATGNLKVGDAAPTVTLNGEDAYVEGTFEVDGTARFDSTVTVSDLTCTDCLDFTELEDSLSLDAAATFITGTAGETLIFSRTLTDATTETGVTFSITAADTTAGTVNQNGVVISNQPSTEGLDRMLLLTNADTDDAADNAIVINSSAGGINTGIDITDTDIGTAIEVGTNDIVGTTANLNFSNFDVTGSTGSIVTAGDLDVNGGDISSTSALTIDTSANGAASFILQSTIGGIDILASGAAAGEDIDIIATGSSINLTSTESIGDAIVISASGAAGGIDLDAGTGGVALTSTSTANSALTVNADSLTSGAGILVSSSSASATSGSEMLELTLTPNVGTASYSRQLLEGNFNLTNSTAGTVTTVANDISRINVNLVANDGAATVSTINYDSTVQGVFAINVDGTEGTNDVITFGADLIHLDQDFADATGDVLEVENSSTGNGINVDQIGNGQGVFIRSDATSASSLVIDQLTAGTVPAVDIDVNTANFALTVFNDGNLDSRDGVQIQACLDTNPTAGCDFVKLLDGNGTILGAIEGNGAGGVTNASAGSDYAELFPGTYAAMAVGDVIGLDTLGNAIKATSDAQLIGAFSIAPNTLGNWVDDWQAAGTYVPVALLGQVPVNVSDENGAIAIGDELTLSSTPGVAAKAIGPGTVIGKALAPLASGTGTIQAYINPHWSAASTLSHEGNASTVSSALALTSLGTADASTTAYDSQILSLRGSAWNGVSAEALSMNLVTDVTSDTDYRLSIRNTSDTEVAYVTDDGSMRLSGDLVLGGKLYPSDQGVAQNAFYIYFDSSLGAGMEYMRTNAAGWSTGSYDFAEMFPSGDVLEAGDIVVFAGQSEHVRRSDSAYDQKIAGIVSTRPGFLAGDAKKGDFPIALAGRVPTKVSMENGAIEIGDPLTSASTQGYAMKATEPGAIVGYALEPYNGSGDDKIVAYVNVSYWSGGTSTGTTNTASQIIVQSSSTNLSKLSMDGDIYMNSHDILNVRRLSGISDRWSIEEDGTIKTEGIVKTVMTSLQNEKVETAAVTSPDVLLTLVGTATLDDGMATIVFEDENSSFNDVISPVAPIRVLVTPNGPVSLYVTEKDNNGFTVQQLGGSDSGITFDWMVSAYRNGFEPEEALELETPVEEPPTEPTDVIEPDVTDSELAPEEVPTEPELIVEEPIQPEELTEPVDPAAPESPETLPSDSPLGDDGGTPAEPAP